MALEDPAQLDLLKPKKKLLQRKLKPVKYLRKRREERELRMCRSDHPLLFRRTFKDIGPVLQNVVDDEGESFGTEKEGKQIPALTGKRIDKWRLLEHLGQGGFGHVFKSSSILPCAYGITATKVLGKKKIDINRYHRQLKDANSEIGLLRRHSHHPNIISMHDVVHTPSNIYIVMERATKDLHYWMHGPADASHYQAGVSQEIMTGILSALKYLHESGVAHLDLKAANILICKRYGCPLSACDIRLADFGLAKVSKNYKPRNTSLHVGSAGEDCLPAKHAVNLKPGRYGTPTHMAPELFDGCDGRIADMWSLGCIFVNMMCSPSYLHEWDESYGYLMCKPADEQGFRQTIGDSVEGLRNAWTPDRFQGGERLHNLMFQNLLVLDVTIRATAAGALQHPWFQ